MNYFYLPPKQPDAAFVNTVIKHNPMEVKRTGVSLPNMLITSSGLKPTQHRFRHHREPG
jgi:hypothetical protein